MKRCEAGELGTEGEQRESVHARGVRIPFDKGRASSTMVHGADEEERRREGRTSDEV